jgi:branched-chain amino acid transport system permease protein
MSLEERIRSWVNRQGTLIILVLPLASYAVLVSIFGGKILQHISIILFINLGLTVALQMFTGNSGVMSLTNIGFMAISAYLAAIFTLGEMKLIAIPHLYPILQRINLPFYVAIIVAAFITTAIAALIIYPILRLEGPAATISTFALLIAIQFLLKNWNEVTNGTRAIFGVPRLTTLQNAAFFGLVCLVVGYWFKKTTLGLKLRASREDGPAAKSIGIDIVRARYTAFILSILISSIAGGLWAHLVGTFTPLLFYLERTLLIVTMLIIGGTGSISGAVIGTAVITGIQEGLRSLENEINLANIFPSTVTGIPTLSLSLLLILILIFRPAGITGGNEIGLNHIKSLLDRIKSRKTSIKTEKQI